MTTPVRVQPVASRTSSSEFADKLAVSDATGTSRGSRTGKQGPISFSDMLYLGRCLVEHPTSQKECEDAMSQLVGAEPLAAAEIVMPCESSHAVHIVDDNTGEDLANIPVRTVVSLVHSTDPELHDYIGLCAMEKHSKMSSRGPVPTTGPQVYYCHVLQAERLQQVKSHLAVLSLHFTCQLIKLIQNLEICFGLGEV